MENLTFKKNIKAPAQKVWAILLGKDTYPEWTAVFAENSAADTDWQKGSKAIFHDGTGNGMVSRIEENIPHQFLSIKHLGEIKNGKEDLNKNWGDAFENYTLEEHDNVTTLSINLSIIKDWVEFMDKTWPQALDKVAALAEE
ncbi:SRPBCC domain-containing protein [Pedobacter aquatilis]|uniref:SRPBCC domain-containing protein n=1 Tax=Pedobacter aquatilis TaxID=351343 RepID=UPI00292DD248|nr:SRPBCC domain-containing protein [Pedobacter aquatilis]